jgi:c-di-GMP-binding flagellar brake protein YcgR
MDVATLEDTMAYVNLKVEKLEQAWLERRHAERVGAKLKVSYRELRPEESDTAVHSIEVSNMELQSKKGAAQDIGSMLDAQTRDVSIGGMRLGGEMQLKPGRPIQPGIFLDLKIAHPETNFSIHAVAMVVWSRTNDSGTFEAGLSFFTIDERDLDKLQEIISKNKSNPAQ